LVALLDPGAWLSGQVRLGAGLPRADGVSLTTDVGVMWIAMIVSFSAPR
jgi:hypothetical protein